MRKPNDVRHGALSLETLAVHAGREDFAEIGVHAPPLDLSTTYPTGNLADATASIDAVASSRLPVGYVVDRSRGGAWTPISPKSSRPACTARVSSDRGRESIGFFIDANGADSAYSRSIELTSGRIG